MSPLLVHAQAYKGGYTGGTKDNQKDKAKAKKPIPRVFSSKVTSVQEAEKLDSLYDDLFVSLWIHANTDFIYQNKFMAQMLPEKFKFTRYSQEFTGDLQDALNNLNKNHSDMMRQMKETDAQYQNIREGIRASDYAVLDLLWQEKMTLFRARAQGYFEMQHKYLNVYRKLVGFVLKQSGGYYYDTTEEQIHFYQFGGYKFYSQSLDRLKKIRYKQRVLLKEHAPANVDFDFE